MCLSDNFLSLVFLFFFGCSNRDLSMILDALLKTKSRAVLIDIINKNGSLSRALSHTLQLVLCCWGIKDSVVMLALL